MSEIKLKPCPFCGGEAYIHTLKKDWLGVGWEIVGYAVVCQKCRTSTEYNENKEVSIKAWNTRTEEEDGRS